MKDDIARRWQHVSQSEEEKRRKKELLKKSPPVTKENLIQIDKRTWIVKRKGETEEQAKERFLKNYKPISNNLYYYDNEL